MMRNAILSIAASALACFAATPALASDAGPGPDVMASGIATYSCESGMVFDATFYEVAGEGAALIKFPRDGADGPVVRRLLPATQTGSGVRYASDITVFHMKGDMALFETAASAQSDAIARTECTLVAAPSGEPLTQGTDAGRYYVMAPNADMVQPTYRAAENFCIYADGSGLLAVMPMGETTNATLISLEDGEAQRINVTIGEVDAGVGQRRYPIMHLSSGQPLGTLHFNAPGMLDRGTIGRGPGFSSVTLQGNRKDCMDAGDIAYAGVSNNGLAVVRLVDGALTLRLHGWDDDDPRGMTGYYSRKLEKGTFHFFDGADRVAIDSAFSGSLGSGAWQISEGGGAAATYTPMAYFQATPQLLLDNAPTVFSDITGFLTRLNFCNHLAGEVSENASRNSQIAEQWTEARCDAVPDEYEDYLVNTGERAALRDYLERTGPNWL